METSKRSAVSIVLMGLFALSGCAGLIYESIWTQYLGLFLGHAAYAQSFVLVLYMGGMAIGAWLASGRSERFARPLVVYGVIELLIGALGLGFDPIYHSLTGFAYTSLFPQVGSGAALDIVRYATAAIVIGPQCVLLGTTFPLMSAGFLRIAPKVEGRVLSSLYFSNSFGAALGALIATFILLPSVGLPGTAMTGGLLSVVVAIAVWPLAKVAHAAVRPGKATARASGGISTSIILAAAAITGATSFVYEITWVRMLVQALGSTIHAFELMLAAFVGGLAFGGLWLRNRMDRWPNLIAAVGWVQLLMGMAALGSLFVYAHAFDWVATLLGGLARSDTGYSYFNFATGFISVAVMFPAAFFAGATLPLLTSELLRSGGGERVIGRVYAANTVGAIVGVLLSIHVLVPFMGARLALWSAALVDVVLGIFLLHRARFSISAMPFRPAFTAVAAIATILAGASFVWTRVDPLVLASSVFRNGMAKLAPGTQMLYYRDGKTATVALFTASTVGKQLSIATNGKVDAGISYAQDKPPSGDEYTMMMAAALPLAMAPSARNVAIIGFGSGLTAHTALGSDALERLDVVEIEPFMVEAARHFGTRVERTYTDPRSHIIYDDAKAYLAASPTRYDAIISEPSNPWVSGVAALFSEEFYDFVPKHLTDDGIFVQWVQLYEISPDLVISIIKAMLPRFADVNAYMTNEADLLLVASGRPLPKPGDLASAFPRMKAELERTSLSNSADFNRAFLMDKRGLALLAATGGYPANSDMFPLLQLQAPRARFTQRNATSIARLQVAPWPLLEALGGYRPLPVSVSPSVMEKKIDRDQSDRTARILLHGMLDGASLVGSHAGAISVLRDQPRQCNGGDVREWIDASVDVAAATIPFLPAEDLGTLWIAPTWVMQCMRGERHVTAMLDFHAALASRNWAAVAALGPSQLEDKGVLEDRRIAGYVLGATELAAAVLHDAELFDRMEKQYGSSIRDYIFERQLMAAAAHQSVRHEETP